MMDVVFDTIIDSVKLLPFLFLTYLAMEYLEHKTSARTKKFVKDSGKAGPVIGALLGAVPQCGFSTAASISVPWGAAVRSLYRIRRS